MQTILNFIPEQERSGKEYRQALVDLAEETDRLQVLVEDLLHLPENKGLELNRNLPPSLVISGDMGLLIRLIVNLVDNAINYTERGSITLSAKENDT